MRLVAFTIPTAVLLGYLAGGRLGRLGAAQFRWPLVGLAGIALQFAPFGGSPGYLLLLGSFVLLFVAAGVNRRLPGFVLVLAGLWLNFLVIAVDHGMPVTLHALTASGQQETLNELTAHPGAKHHLATSADVLLPLADRIPIGSPVHQAVSFGDLLVHAGAIWFVVRGMRGGPAVVSTSRSELDVAEASS
jgi:hypothetical protein